MSAPVAQELLTLDELADRDGPRVWGCPACGSDAYDEMATPIAHTARVVCLRCGWEGRTDQLESYANV